jgi:hypothetical protein
MEPVYTLDFVVTLCLCIVVYMFVGILTAARYNRQTVCNRTVGEVVAEASFAGVIWPIVFVYSYFE